MHMWIPVESDKGLEAKIVPQFEAKKWALVELEGGEVKALHFYDTHDSGDIGWVDFVILKNKYENYLDFMNEGMMVLVVRQEETIEEIIDAFKFKELDEIGL